MDRATRSVSFGLGTGRFPEGLHACHIFNDDDERAATLAKYFASGLAEGERALCLFDAMGPDEVSASLAATGVDVAAIAAQFGVAPAESAYCPGGVFEPDTCLSAFGEFSVAAQAEGWTGTRIMGDMGWSLRRETVPDRLLEYEAKVKDYIDRFHVTAACEYDARRFDGALILDLLAMHPATIVRGQILWNPFYEEPAAYLARRRGRSAPLA